MWPNNWWISKKSTYVTALGPLNGCLIEPVRSGTFVVRPTKTTVVRNGGCLATKTALASKTRPFAEIHPRSGIDVWTIGKMDKRTIKDVDPLLTIKDVCEVTRLSRATIYRRIWDGHFPSPKRIGSRTVRWPLSSVRAWLRDLPTNG